MLTLIGILILLLAGGKYFLDTHAEGVKAHNDAIDQEIADNEKRIKQILDDNPRADRSDALRHIGIGRKKSNIYFSLPGRTWMYAVTSVVIFALNGMFFWANAGTAYAVQYPWGGDKIIKTQGLKVKYWGRTIPLSYEIAIKDELHGESGGGDGVYHRGAKLWEFSDAIKARIATAVVIGIEINDEEVFLTMADANRSENKLIYARVMPNVDAALKNTAKLMDAQEYISGAASDFDRYFRDQLENGAYIVEAYVEEAQDPEVIGKPGTERTVSNKDTKSKQTKYRIKRDKNGDIMRDNQSNTLKQYGIRIIQAQVTNIDWEDSFDKRLDLQKNEVAKTQLEKQEAERQFYTTQKEIAKGEAEKAKERAKLEKEQIKLTIAAETEAKVAVQNLIAEKKKYEVAQFEAKSIKVLADAESYKNRALVKAGLTPQERAEYELKTATAVAREFAKMQTPGVVITGSQGKGGDLTSSLIQAQLATEIIKGNKVTKQ